MFKCRSLSSGYNVPTSLRLINSEAVDEAELMGSQCEEHKKANISCSCLKFEVLPFPCFEIKPIVILKLHQGESLRERTGVKGLVLHMLTPT